MDVHHHLSSKDLLMPPTNFVPLSIDLYLFTTTFLFSNKHRRNPHTHTPNRANYYRTVAMTQNEHVYAICCCPEVDDDVISGRNVKTIAGYIVVDFKVASSSSFRDFPKRLFCDGEVDDGSVA